MKSQERAQLTRFPGLRKLIAQELALLKKRDRWPDTREEKLPAKIGCSKGTLNAWLHGYAFPNEEHTEKLAKFFYGGDSEGAKDFLRRLEQSRNATDILTVEDLKERRSLTLGYLEYPPFCRLWERPAGAPDRRGFMDEL